MDNLIDFLSPWKAFATKILSFLPNLFAAIIITSLGFVVAKIAKSITLRFLDTVHFENAVEKAGIKEIFNKGDIRETPSSLISLFMYWIVILVFLLASLN